MLVSADEGMRVADDLGCVYAECSALTQKGLKEVFDAAVKQALRPPSFLKQRRRTPMERALAFVKRFTILSP